MSAVYEKLLDHWRATEVPIAVPGDRRARVEEIERRYGVTLPEDFRAYLLHASPDEETWDDDTSWWNVAMVKNIPDELENEVDYDQLCPDAPYYIFFADYLCWCYAWAICCKPGDDFGRIAVINGRNTRIVADNFAEFVEIFVTESDSLS